MSLLHQFVIYVRAGVEGLRGGQGISEVAAGILSHPQCVDESTPGTTFAARQMSEAHRGSQ